MANVPYGAPRTLSEPVDWALFTNDQYGFTTTLDSTKQTFTFASPFPSGFNLEDQTIKMKRMDYNMARHGDPQDFAYALSVYLSMLEEDFPGAFGVLATNADKQTMRSQFDGPIKFGQTTEYTTDATLNHEGTTISQQINSDTLQIYYPPIAEVDLLTPLYQQFVNETLNTTDTAFTVRADFDQNDTVTYRQWFEVRNLTSAEKSMRGNQLQWLRLNS